jgi:hypothetical protein
MTKLLLTISTSLCLAACGTTVTQTVPILIEISPALLTHCAPADTVPERIVNDVYENRDLWHDAFDVCAARNQQLIKAVTDGS